MLRDLALSPSLFFGELAHGTRELGWGFALAGYYLASFVQAYSDLLSARPEVATLVALRRAIVSSLLLLPFAVVLWGVVWLWLGARLFRGRPALGATAKAVSYALLVPGLLCTVLLAPALTLWRGLLLAPPGVFAFVASSLVFAAWCLVNLWKAIRSLSGLGRPATVGAFLWLPLLVFIAIAADEWLLR